MKRILVSPSSRISCSRVLVLGTDEEVCARAMAADTASATAPPQGKQ